MFEVVKNVESKKIEHKPFPKLMFYPFYKMIALMVEKTSENTRINTYMGVVLDPGTSFLRKGGSYMEFSSTDNFEYDHTWVDYEGEITIRNL